MDEIVAFAELEQFIDLPVRTYSSGMYMRLGFSVAAHIEADVLLLDEVFAVGDEEFQRKCFGKIHEFKSRGGTIVFVSHDAQAVERLCDRAVLLRQGAVAFDGADPRGDRASTGGCSPTSASPDELAAGLREWGSGEARIVSARLLDADGDERRPVRGRRADRRSSSRVASEPDVAPPQRLARAARRRRRRARRRHQATAELGWDARAGERELRFELDRLPLADGRFHLRCALARRATAGGCCTRSTTRSGSSSSRPAPRPARSCSTGRWRCRRSAPSAPIAPADDAPAPAPTGRS